MVLEACGEVQTLTQSHSIPRWSVVVSLQIAEKDKLKLIIQEGLAVASIAQDVVVEMTPPRDDNAR